MQQPVSVVIVNFNAGPGLVDCVASIVASRYPAQIVVVDNDSQDDSIERLTAAFGTLEALHIVRNDANLGFSKACNIGARRSSAPYLLFLNPDCLIYPDTIPSLVQALEKHPDAGLAGGMLLNPDGSEQAGGRRAVPTPWRVLVRISGLFHLKHRYPGIFSDYLLHQEPLADHEMEVEATSGACMMMPRKAMEAAGCFDEEYFLHVEDLDCCMRMREKGFKVLFVPGAKVMHRKGVCGRDRPVFVEWHKHRGLVRFYGKYFRRQYPGLLMALLFGGVWAHFLVVAALRLLRGKSPGDGEA